MNLITAMIQPYQTKDVQTALAEKGINGMTVSEVKGYGRQKGRIELYRGSEYCVDFVPKMKIEILCIQSQTDTVVQTITDTCRTGKVGDGKIFVQTIDKIVRIRTGEEDHEAL